MGAAPNPVAIGVQAGTSLLRIGLALLAAHTARLHDAADENTALDALVPSYDADVQEIQAAYNGGTHSAAQCLGACQKVADQAHAYLIAQVGKPGTAFVDTGSAPFQPGKPCNKGCTAGCCVYYNDLLPGLSNVIAAIQTAEGTPTQQNNGQVSTTAQIPKVYPPSRRAYGNYSRAAYALPFVRPPLAESTLGSLQSTVDELLGQAPPQGVFSNPSAGKGPSAGVNPLLLMLGAGFIFVAAVFAVLLRR